MLDTNVIITALISTAGGALATVLSFRIGKHNAKNDYTTTLATRIEKLETRVTQLEGHKSVLTNYATELRQHIEEQKPPPPPPWPIY